MGAIFGEPNYLDNLVLLAEEYGVGDRIPILTSNIWTWDDSSYANMTTVDGDKFLPQSIAKVANTTLQNAIPLLISTINRYNALHRFERAFSSFGWKLYIISIKQTNSLDSNCRGEYSITS